MSSNKVKTQIIHAPNLVEFEQVLKKSDNLTLVVFDIDEVIFTSIDQVLHPSYRKHLDVFMKGLNDNFGPDETKKLWTIINKARKRVIIDPTILQIFDYLQNNEIKTIGLTHWPTGAMVDGSMYQHLRILQLEEFGIDFHRLSPFKDELSLTNVHSERGNPLMHKGVVLTGLVEKGIVLEHILNAINFKPEKVIFIDDLIENIISVEASCTRLGIEFVGFEYTAVADSPLKEFIEKRAQLQFENLIKEGIWLSDEEAEIKLTNDLQIK